MENLNLTEIKSQMQNLKELNRVKENEIYLIKLKERIKLLEKHIIWLRDYKNCNISEFENYMLKTNINYKDWLKENEIEK